MDQSPGSERGISGVRRRDALACLFLVAFFVAWHSAGVFGGQVYMAEDTAAYFFSNRAVHHDLAASGDFSFWDPLPGLGQPRLANIQNGSFAPLTLLFYGLPTATVFQFYPALVLALLSLATYALFRAKGVTQWPALFGSLSFTTTGAVLTHVQHLAVIETLLFLPVTLLFWELAIARRQGRWAVLAGVALSFQCFGSSAQYLLYDGLVMALWMGRDLLAVRAEREKLRERLVFVAGIAGVGFGLASWQLLPFLEMVQQSHRSLLNDPDLFSGLFRAAPHEVPLALAAEVFAWMPPRLLEHGAPYRNQPQLSLLTLVLAAFSMWKRPRPWAAAVGVALFLLGMLGAEGFVTPLLREIFPFADRLRAPYRMLVPASFLLAWLAALGLQRVLHSELSWRQPLAGLCVGWLVFVGWTLKRPLDHYVEASAYSVPDVVGAARGRVVADFLHSQRMPPFVVNAGLAAGVPTLLMREVLIPANFFEAYFAGQYGTLEPAKKFDRAIVAAALPFENPDAPIWDAFGVKTVVRFREGRFEVERRMRALDRFSLIPVAIVEENAERFRAQLASRNWDPRQQALLRRPVAGLPEPDSAVLRSEIRVVRDEKDGQTLEVESTGGVLVTSGLFFPGWQVEVDGQPAEVLEVDGALRGVVLSAGLHRVDWQYRPTWLPWAFWGSGLAGLSALALLEHDRRRGRKAARAGFRSTL